MKKCGLYARVSTLRQVRVIEGSLDTQLDMLDKYVDIKNGTTDDEWVIAEIYREEGKSGGTANRPEYQRMLHDIKVGKIDTLLCTKLDRITRSMRDFLDLFELLEAHNVTFISLNENWDTSSSMGRFALTISLAAAQLERERTSERTKEKMQWRAEQGLTSGGRILGYDPNPDNKGVPLANGEEKVLVNQVYDIFCTEKCFQRVAKILNNKGFRTKSYVTATGKFVQGKRFTDTSIGRILQNVYYIGKISFNGEVYEGKHEAIVALPLFEKVQKIIKTNKEQQAKQRKQNIHPYILQGLVRCSKCGSFMTPSYSYNHQKKAYAYYGCTATDHAGKAACDMKRAPAVAFENLIAERIIQLKDDRELVSSMVSNASFKSTKHLKDLKHARDIAVKRRSEADTSITNLVDQLAAGGTQIKSVSQRIVDLEEQKDQLNKEIRQLDVQIAEQKKKVVRFDKFTNTLTTFSELYADASAEQKKELMQLHLHQIIWSPDTIQMALYEIPASPELLTRSGKVQRESTSGSGGRTRTYDPVVNDNLFGLGYWSWCLFTLLD